MTVKLPPMPPQIEALPRDKRGYPVPFVADWTSRKSEPEIATHRRYGRISDCSCRTGQGEPILGEPCLRKARVCIWGRLCSTCGQDIRTGSSMVWPSAEGDKAPFFTEPANHPECLEWALRVCPFLVTKGREPDGMSIVTAHHYRVMQIRLTRTAGLNLTELERDISPRAHREASGYLYGYALEPTDPTRTPVDEWLAKYSQPS